MIFSIRNRYLRGLAGWLLMAAFVLAFPFLVVVGGVVDVWRNLKAEWQSSKGERRHAWRLMTFRSVE